MRRNPPGMGRRWRKSRTKKGRQRNWLSKSWAYCRNCWNMTLTLRRKSWAKMYRLCWICLSLLLACYRRMKVQKNGSYLSPLMKGMALGLH